MWKKSADRRCFVPLAEPSVEAARVDRQLDALAVRGGVIAAVEALEAPAHGAKAPERFDGELDRAFLGGRLSKGSGRMPGVCSP